MPVVATSNEERFTKIFPHLVRKKFRATVPRPNAFSWGEHFTRNCEKWVEQIPPKMRSEKTDADGKKFALFVFLSYYYCNFI